MTEYAKSWVIGLASLSAACELFGTLCVLHMYWSNGNLARDVIQDVRHARRINEAWQQTPAAALRQASPEMANIRVDRVTLTTYDNLEIVFEPLMRKRIYNAGFAALIVGALAGLAAAVIATVG